MVQHRIIVIGSGVSGLACARELVQRGYEVLVVEARSRVGGRLKGEPLELGSNEEEDSASQQQNVDLGGALIHGIDNNPMHSITTQMGVPLHAISDYCLLLDENGWPFDPKVDDKISTLFNECLDITFQRVEQDKAAKTSFGALFDQVCQEQGVRPDNPLIQWHQANLELPSGAGFHDLGYTWNDDEPYGFAGIHAAVEPSWKFVMDRLADGLDILYHSPVTQIQVVLPDGTTPSSFPSSEPTTTVLTNTPDDEPEPMTVETSKTPAAEPKEEEPDAVPVALLPRRTEWRNAALPNLKLLSSPTRFSRRVRGEDVNLRRSTRSNKGKIKMLQIGNKNSLSYDDPTKKHHRRKRDRKSTSDFSDQPEDESEELPSSTVQVTLQNGTVLEANAVVCTLPLGILKLPPQTPGHVQFQPPLPENKRTAFDQLGCGLLNKCVMSFSHVFWQDSQFLGLAGTDRSYLVLNATKYSQKPILIFMYGGGFAKELESWTDTAVVEDCLRVLKKICGMDIPAPIDYCVTRWGQEQYSRMAFTCIPPGVNGPQQLAAAGEVIGDPARPKKPLIMFAGEHTTPYHPSTMHGAFLSGIREAYRYDLHVEPELNDNMEFDTDHKLYEHTFPTRRVYKTATSSSNSKKASKLPASEPAASSSQSRSRRRRFAGMTLRKQPKQVLEVSVPAGKATATSSQTLEKSRRSQRSLSAKKDNNGEAPNEKSETEMVQKKTKTINELEDRTLLRSLESYGRDCAMVRSKIVPVFGSTRKRNADQIRARWHQLATRKRRAEVWKSWQALTVAPLPQDIGAPSPSRVPAPKDIDGNVRRSRREVKPRLLQDF